MRRHISISIAFLLKCDDEFLEDFFDAPAAETRAELEQRQANGELKVGSVGCEGFDPVTGCPGHHNK